MINDAIAGIAGIVALWLAFELWSHWYGRRQAARHNAEAAKILADEKRELARQTAKNDAPIEWEEVGEYRNYLDAAKLCVVDEENISPNETKAIDQPQEIAVH